MSVNYRQIASDNSHLRYNQNVNAGETIIEFARFGSILVNADIAIVAISAFLDYGKSYGYDFPIKSETLADNAINYGLRILIQRALNAGLRKPSKTADAARDIVAKQLPRLIGN
jgi:hypothetical protein